MAIQKKVNFQECTRCGQSLGIGSFSPSKNKLFVNGYLPVCDQCLVEMVREDLKASDGNIWDVGNKYCQWINVPFVPARWQEMYDKKKEEAITAYIRVFFAPEYEGVEWFDYEQEYRELKEEGTLNVAVIPGYTEQKLKELRAKWGANYDDEELTYLEQLYNGILATQSVNGALQTDQALKLCKLSLTIDSRIRGGGDIDKLLASYERIVKVAEFTPRNVKNAQDFDSVGELFSYLEKTGFINKFYDGVKRDVVDITMNNIQSFCQRLYTQESGIGEDIERRIESLKCAQEIEYNMGLTDDFASDQMTQQVDDYFDQEEFNPEV